MHLCMSMRGLSVDVRGAVIVLHCWHSVDKHVLLLLDLAPTAGLAWPCLARLGLSKRPGLAWVRVAWPGQARLAKAWQQLARSGPS